MSEKIGLKIVDLIHDISRYEFTVGFSADFEGMLTVDVAAQYGTWSTHTHLGIPGGERSLLEKEIIECLSTFLQDLKSGKRKHE